MAQSVCVRFPVYTAAPGLSRKAPVRGGVSSPSGPKVAQWNLVFDPVPAVTRPALGDPTVHGSPQSGERHSLAPGARRKLSEEEDMDKVTAAMVLTSLSTSPLVRSPPVKTNDGTNGSWKEGGFTPSSYSSSGYWSWCAPSDLSNPSTPSPPLSTDSCKPFRIPSQTDDGIDEADASDLLFNEPIPRKRKATRYRISTPNRVRYAEPPFTVNIARCKNDGYHGDHPSVIPSHVNSDNKGPGPYAAMEGAIEPPPGAVMGFNDNVEVTVTEGPGGGTRMGKRR
ncbi:UNVERIFIED_CONTAM: hypothetical protein FKN15_058542 [Acipenser sinensis]